jgi:hypothetical protein
VVVFAALHAPRASRLRRGRPVALPAGDAEPEAVPITRVTVIAAEPFASEDEAREWLVRCGGRGEHDEEELRWATGHVNVAVSAYRVAAADAHARDVSSDQALRVRIGYGSGSDLVSGAWNEALLMPPHRGGQKVRRRMLSPEEELAGILTGRRPAGFPSEELLLRARLDLDAGRHVEATLQTRIAAEALAAELEGGGAPDAARYAEGAGALCEAALSGGLTDAQAAELRRIVSELERTVRRRRYT